MPVPENPAQPDGRKIPIHLAVIPARKSTANKAPLFMFAGGPGQGAIDSFAPLLNRFHQIRQQRDIVLIDQRGTGQSNPLNCPAQHSQVSEPLAPEQLANYVRDCLQQLKGDPRFYTTSIAISDFEQIRQSLGYDKIHILGVSYGTRVAQTYLKYHPDSISTVILDGVLPTELVVGSEHATNLQQTLNDLFKRCERSNDCNKRFPRLQAKLQQLVQKTTEAPPTLTVKHPVSGKTTEIQVSKDVLATAIRLLSYAPETQALLPLLISEAADNNDLGQVATSALMIEGQLQGAISRGMEWSVICSEDYAHALRQPKSPAGDDPALLLGDVMTQISEQVCPNWRLGSSPRDFHKAFSSSTPVLLLSGEYDPVTPPKYGEQALQQYANGRHIVAKGQGHSVIQRGCMPAVINQFLNDESNKNLDMSCLQPMGNTPFFTTLMGAEP
ncbi:alpha/beta fold hydrolase [bacterium SCSIO 12696]|nr:alpha/beta fold hydrolase [bacterium SCSIO 12696]